MKDLKKLFKILKDKRIEKAYSFRQLENITEMLELSGVDKRLLNPNQESNIKSIEEIERLELPVYGIASAVVNLLHFFYI